MWTRTRRRRCASTCARFRPCCSSRTARRSISSWAPTQNPRSRREFRSTCKPGVRPPGPRRRSMRASAARLTNSPVRLAELSFPQVNRLIHRTRLAFVHLDNLLAFAKRDRDGRVDGYVAAYLPEECLLVFFRKGEAVNAASMHPGGRQVITITEGLRRMREEVERGELAYHAAPMEQLAWMYQACAAPAEPRYVDPTQPAALFPALAHKAIGIINVPRASDTPDAVVRPDELALALTDWSLQVLEGLEVVMPGSAPKVLKDATREHRYVLQAAGFYQRLPWPVQW